MDKVFNCPFSDCVFHTKKHFKRKILLNQHLLNRHSEKRYKCQNCLKQYAIEWQLKYHLKACGLNFTCLTCNRTYKERLSLITHCKRNSHSIPENVKLPKKESQKGKESKFRPILPKNDPNNLIDHSFNVDKSFNTIANSFQLVPNQLNAIGNSSANEQSLQTTNCLIDTSCQTDNLCQCSDNLNRKTKSTNTLSVQCPEISTYSNLKFKTKSTHNDKPGYSDSHTQTSDSSFASQKNQQEYRDQSTSTDAMNSLNELSSKKSVAIETTLNDLNINYCFFNDEQDLINHNLFSDHNPQASSLNDPNVNTPIQDTPNKDPLLSTISVQTDLDYNLNYLVPSSDVLKSDQFDFENCLQLNDIQTQTYLNDFNDNTTQTDDFLLDIDIFNN